MKNRHIFLIGAVIVLVMAFFFFKGKKRHKVVDDTEVETSDEVAAAPQKAAAMPINAPAAVSSTTVKNVGGASKVALSPAILKSFVDRMKEAEKCLSLTAQPNMASEVNPTAESLISMLKPSLGEVVVQIDDWSQFDIVDKSGTKKRVRVDFDYPDGVTPTRRLSMYTVNSYGALEIDNLSNDQSDNPNEAYIESLKEGSQQLGDEKSSRVYFSQGEELAFTLKNGQLDTFNISRGERAVNCSGLSEENSKCSCP